MVQLSRFLASIALFSCTFAVPTGVSVRHHHKGAAQNATCPGLAAPTGRATANAKAIYFITNDACNSVVALRVAADGTLSDGSITSTGGAGMNAIDSATGGPAAPDALFSQGAVKVAGNVRKFIHHLNLPANSMSDRIWLLLTPAQIPFRCSVSVIMIQQNLQLLARLSIH